MVWTISEAWPQAPAMVWTISKAWPQAPAMVPGTDEARSLWQPPRPSVYSGSLCRLTTTKRVWGWSGPSLASMIASARS